MKRGLDWRDLQYFLAVARSGSLSVAGRQLGVDHATVSRHIQSLERAVDASLFERHPRGYVATRSGERLIATVEAMEKAAGQVSDASDGGLSGTVRIGALEGFANFFLAPRIGLLLADNPELTVEVETIQQIVSLSRRHADIAITLAPPAGSRLIGEALGDYRLFVYGTSGYLAAHPPICARDDLAQHMFAGYVDELLFTRELDYHEALGIPPRAARIQNSSIHAQMEAARSGICLAVLPAFVAATKPDLVRVLPDAVNLTRSYWLITRAEDRETRRIRQLCSLLHREVARAHALFMGQLSPES